MIRAEMRHETVNLSAIAEEIAANLRQSEPQRKVDFVIAPQMMAHGDPHLLRIVLENLLGNAWKYTGKHPTARIEFGMISDCGIQKALSQLLYDLGLEAGLTPVADDPLLGKGEPMQNKIILLVEDDPDDRDLIRRAWRANGIWNEIVYAADGQQALNFLFGSALDRPDDPIAATQLVVLDLNMPGMGGLECLRRVRAAPNSPRSTIYRARLAIPTT